MTLAGCTEEMEEEVRAWYGANHVFMRCKNCNKETTGTWRGLCYECMRK